jgi:hypothetical protein
MATPHLSKPRLERMRQVLSGYVERQELPGLVTLVSRYDDVHVEALGNMFFANRRTCSATPSFASRPSPSL